MTLVADDASHRNVKKSRRNKKAFSELSNPDLWMAFMKFFASSCEVIKTTRINDSFIELSMRINESENLVGH